MDGLVVCFTTHVTVTATVSGARVHTSYTLFQSYSTVLRRQHRQRRRRREQHLAHNLVAAPSTAASRRLTFLRLKLRSMSLKFPLARAPTSTVTSGPTEPTTPAFTSTFVWLTTYLTIHSLSASSYVYMYLLWLAAFKACVVAHSEHIRPLPSLCLLSLDPSATHTTRLSAFIATSLRRSPGLACDKKVHCHNSPVCPPYTRPGIPQLQISCPNDDDELKTRIFSAFRLCMLHLSCLHTFLFLLTMASM